MKSLLAAIEKAAGLARLPMPETSLSPWPRFSLASYAVTARLANEGITPRTVVDVGANTGQFTMACMRRFRRPRIYAFEPVLEAFQSLCKAAKKFKEISAYNIAVGERDGVVAFHVASDTQSSSILAQNGKLSASFPGTGVIRTVELEMKTLQTALRGVALEPPVLLKLDVQGYEAKVIGGAGSFLDNVDYIVAETSFSPLYEGETTFLSLVKLLRDHSFTFRRPVGILISPVDGTFLQIDALFCRGRLDS
jgi:FkbM family methyltransferase